MGRDIDTGIYLLKARHAFLLHILGQVGLPQLKLQLPESWDVLRIFHAISALKICTCERFILTIYLD